MDNANVTKKLTGSTIAALLIFGAVAAALVIVPQTAYAAVTITTSADSFFGPSLVRVEIKDDALVGAPADTISVRVAAKDGSTELGANASVDVVEIGTSSGTFEFFITTSDSPLDPTNPTFATIGGIVARINTAPALDGNDESVIIGSPLEDGNTVEITYGGQTKVVRFEATTASLTADRAVAGEGNRIVLSMTDRDANTDPTAVDSFTFGTPTDLLTVTGGAITYPGGAIWTETGQNTGIFELAVTVNGATPANFFAATLPSGKSFTLIDHDVYEVIAGATAPFDVVTSTTSSSSASVTLQNADGLISIGSPVTFANGIKLNINDPDRNISTKSKDLLSTVFVELDGGFAQTDHTLVVTTTGGVVTTTGASTTGNVAYSQDLTFSSDPGAITAVTATPSGGGVTAAAGSVIVTGSGNTRTITANVPFTTAGAVTDVALGTTTITITTPASVNVGLFASTSSGAPAVTGDGGATAGVGNTQATPTITDANAGAASVTLQETDNNTGNFTPNVTENKVPISFGGSTTVTATGITLTASDVAGDPDIIIVYRDPARDPTGTATFNLITSLQHTPGALTATPSVDINGKFSMTLNDSDLNTNAQTAETYTATFTGTTAAVALGPNMLGFTIDNAAFNLPSPITLTFIETGPNTGIFVASNVDMSILTADISTAAGTQRPEDGDQVKATYTDNMEDPTQDSDFTITIGKPSESVEASRTTLPIPLSGDSVKVTLTVVDPTANLNNASTEQVTLTSVTIQDKNGASPGTAVLSVSPSPVTLTETGINTGIFTRTVTITGTTGNAGNNDGAKIVFDYNGNKASVVLKSFDLTITTSSSSVGSGDTLVVTLTDADRNLDPTIVDKVTFTIQGVDDDQTLVTLTADETGPNTGVFSKSMVVNTDFKISTITTTSASMSTQIEIKATDAIASDLSIGVVRERTIGVATGTGGISVEPLNPGPGTKAIIRIVDKDLDTSPTGVQTIQASAGLLKIVTDRTGVSTTNLGMKETGPNTGIFEHEVTFTPLVGSPSITVNTDESTVEVLPGDIVAVRYTDEVNSSGSKVTVSVTFAIVSQDPEITSTATSVKVGDGFPLTIKDSDANKDGDITDTVSIRVTSNSDAVGFTTTFIETGPNTGEFTGTIQTTDGVDAGSVTVKVGDSVTVKYTDTYPADYADRVKLVVDPSKDFFFNMPVGLGPGTPQSTTPTAPALTDLSGSAVTQVASGQQVVINTTVRNNEQGSRVMAAIVEVRDSSGFTTYLQFQEGTIQGSGETRVGISWTPDAPGSYQIRVFVVSNIVTPQALSSVVTSSVTVN